MVRWSLRAVLALWVLVIVAWASLHWLIVPRIDDFRPRIERLVSHAVGATVTMAALRAQSNGLVPTVAVHDLRVDDPSGQPALQAGRVLATFSVASLLRGRLEQLVVEQPALDLRRAADGRLWLGGLDLSGGTTGDRRALDWVFAQDEIVVREGRLSWLDERRGVPPLRLHAVDATLQNGPRRHQFRVDATPEPDWGQRFTLIGQFRQRLLSLHAGDWSAWSGQLHASFPRLALPRWFGLADLPADWGLAAHAGDGALRLWLDVRQGAPAGATLDVALRQLSVTLGPDLEPLVLTRLLGRVDWRREPDGMRLATSGLQFAEPDGTTWPGGNVAFSQRADADQPLRNELRADRLDLAALARLAARLPLPQAVRERLHGQHVAGLVERLQARWSGALQAPRDWQLRTRASRLAIGARPAAAPGPGIPGVEGASLEVEAGPAGGSAALAIQDGALEFPGVFEQPRVALAELSAQVRWRVEGERLAVDVPELTLRNEDASGRFQARWHSGEQPDGSGPRFPGVLDLSGAFSRASAAAVHRYLPLSLPQPARHYVRDAVLKGEGRDVAVRVAGRLREVPFNLPGEVGEFRIAGPVSGVVYGYVPRNLQPAGQPPWPALEGLAGELAFERAGMRVQGASASVQGHPGWRFANVQAEIADFNRPRVKVQADGSGALDAALGIVRASPVAGFTQHALDAARGTAAATLALALELPIDDLERSTVHGQVGLQGNDLRFSPGSPTLAQARGAVRFSERGFAVEDVRVRLLGGEAVVSGGSTQGAPAGAPPVLLRASGSASAQGLREMERWGPVAELARHAEGEARYDVRIGFRGETPEIVVESDLQGMALALPEPLAKSAPARWPLRFESGPVQAPDGPPREHLRVRVADLLAIDYEYTASIPARVLRGAVALGAQALPRLAMPPRGVQAWIDTDRLDAGAWLGLARGDAGSPGALAQQQAAARTQDDALPGRWSVQVAELRFDQRTLHDVTLSATRESDRWRAQVQARELAGQVEYLDAGEIRARLARLEVPADDDAPSGHDEATPPKHLPALDIVVDDFTLRGKRLGRLDVQAANREVAASGGAEREWQLAHLRLTTPEAQLQASGRWLPAPGAGGRSATTLDFRLDIHDGGALLERFGMHDVARRGEGQIEGRLSWAGTPLSPDYASMDGQVHLDVGAGQFLKADPGIAKLLGVLSLQALPRRLTLDFRDVFSSGFAFDFLRGDARIAHGVATTDNLQMKGVNAAVLMNGSVDLAHETQRLRVLVVPEIDAGTAALAATLINPAIGIGAFLAQLVLKGPLAAATTREFEVSGSWENPEFQPVKVPADAGSAAPTATRE